MNFQRPALYVLPAGFLAMLFGGYPALDFALTDMGLERHELGFLIPVIIVTVNSFIFNFWLLAITSGQPAYKHWKPVLVFYLVIIFPGSILFAAGSLFISYFFEVYFFSFFPIATWIVNIHLLGVGAYALLRSRLFSPYIGDQFRGCHAGLFISAIVSVLLINFVIIMYLLVGAHQ